MMAMQLYLSALVFGLCWCSSIQLKPKFTIDEFFNFTYFPLVSLSPDGQSLLVRSRRPDWDSNNFENSLWLYDTRGRQPGTLITNQVSERVQPKWSPSGSWIVFMTEDNVPANPMRTYQLQFFNMTSKDLVAIDIGSEAPSSVSWSSDDAALYMATVPSVPDVEDPEWKNVIRHRHRTASDGSSLRRLDLSLRDNTLVGEVSDIGKLDQRVGELVFAPSVGKLTFNFIESIIESTSTLEIYSMDVGDVSSLTKLTDNEALEQSLQLSMDGRHLFYLTYSLSGSHGRFNNTQQRVYSINLSNGDTERWGSDFVGNIMGFTRGPQGGVFFLGQLGINVGIYSQQSPSQASVLLAGWEGSYQTLTAAFSGAHTSLAFVHSSFTEPDEIYFVERSDQLSSARRVTDINQLITEREIPQTKLYRWQNTDDNRTIEGILHYPPGKSDCERLPLMVHIHGGPNDASMNVLHGTWFSWAPLAATEGWLVFEPNYRGSNGYGDDFLSEIRFDVLTKPGKDILDGVDQLVADGIADPDQLAIGGFSYGGFLTNWLITQTTRFNAAVSGAGAADQVSAWGSMDMPLFMEGLLGGFAWEIPERYQKESAIYHLGNVRTPLHLCTGENDIRVPVAQSYLLERGLHYLGVPVQLLLFPKQGHSLRSNPWHPKIKAREELKWLAKYGHQRTMP